MNNSDIRMARPDWEVAKNPAQTLVTVLWDAVWSWVLALITGAAELLRTGSGVVSNTFFFVLFIGTAAFNRDFSHLRIGPIYITEFCLAVLSVTVGILVYHKKRVLLPSGSAARRIIVLVFGFFLLGLFRLIIEAAEGLSAGVIDTFRNFALVYYALFAVITWIVLQHGRTREKIRQMLAAIVIVSTITNLWTVIRYVLGFPLLADDTEVDVSKVIPGHAVVFAMFSFVIIIFALRSERWARQGLFRATLVVALLLNCLYVYLSGHRSAILGCILGASTMLTGFKSRFRLRIRWGWVILACVAVVIAWQFLSNYLIEFTLKYETFLDLLEEPNAAWRAAFWLNMVSLWLSSPVLGVGFSHDFFNEEPFHAAVADHYDPHNSYLAILARTGVVGLFIFGVTAFLGIKLLIRMLRHSKCEETVLIAGCLLSCFTALSVFASMNVTLESPYHAIFFWLIIGMIVALAENERADQSSDSMPSRRRKA
jgi:O-Antigen ligase